MNDPFCCQVLHGWLSFVVVAVVLPLSILKLTGFCLFLCFFGVRVRLCIIEREEWHFATKLVRGAYMILERQRADELSYESPIHETIENTHTCYDNGVRINKEFTKTTPYFISNTSFVVHLLCICCAFVVHLLFICCAFVVHLLCICCAFVVHVLLLCFFCRSNAY